MTITAATCSLIVATRYRAEALDTCLSAVNGLQHRPAEVIVVDNSDGDVSTVRIAAQHGARYMVASDTGLSGARNAGVRVASGEVVAFIDDDAIPQPGWLPALCLPFADEEVVAVTGRIIPNRVDSPAQQRFSAMGWLDLGSKRVVFDRTTEDWFERANFGGVGLGGNMAFRRSVFDDWSGFRESFGLGATLPGGEENYAFFELIRRGHAVAYEPDAVVTHPFPATFPALRALQRRLLGQAVAYGAILFAEEPEFRRRLLHYAWRKVVRRNAKGVRGPGRPSSAGSLPPTDVAAAFMKASVFYRRCRRVKGIRKPSRGRPRTPVE